VLPPLNGDWEALVRRDVMVLEPCTASDLRMLQGKEYAQTLNRPGLLLRTTEIKNGEPVFTVGRSSKRKTVALRDCGALGKVLNCVDNTPRCWDGWPGKDARYIQTNLEAKPGDSGSPVLDREGRVIGLMAGGGYVISAKTILETLEYCVGSQD
jgi:hypothetical protein